MVETGFAGSDSVGARTGAPTAAVGAASTVRTRRYGGRAPSGGVGGVGKWPACATAESLA